MEPTEVAFALQGYSGKAAQTILELVQQLASKDEEIAALKAFLSPVAVPPVAEQPFRDVTHIDLPEDPV